MRHFQLIDHFGTGSDSQLLSLTCASDPAQHVEISMRREGEHLVMSFSYNALEIALRPRFNEFMRALTHMQPVDGLNTTRQIGTGNAYLALGLHTDGSLIMRPTLVGDATGYITLNLKLTGQAYHHLMEWLGVPAPQLPNEG
ncbi:MAG: hypothetical protein IAE80_20225 [Anaerolinea sp.]|nr:hypothetical protein [Anaerolinea sp.]